MRERLREIEDWLKERGADLPEHPGDDDPDHPKSWHTWLCHEIRRIRAQNERLAKRINDTEHASRDLIQFNWDQAEQAIDGYRENNGPEIVTAPWYLANPASWPEHYPCWTVGSASSEVGVAYKEEDVLDYWAPLQIPGAPGIVLEGKPHERSTLIDAMEMASARLKSDRPMPLETIARAIDEALGKK